MQSPHADQEWHRRYPNTSTADSEANAPELPHGHRIRASELFRPQGSMLVGWSASQWVTKNKALYTRRESTMNLIKRRRIHRIRSRHATLHMAPIGPIRKPAEVDSDSTGRRVIATGRDTVAPGHPGCNSAGHDIRRRNQSRIS